MYLFSVIKGHSHDKTQLLLTQISCLQKESRRRDPGPPGKPVDSLLDAGALEINRNYISLDIVNQFQLTQLIHELKHCLYLFCIQSLFRKAVFMPFTTHAHITRAEVYSTVYGLQWLDIEHLNYELDVE